MKQSLFVIALSMVAFVAGFTVSSSGQAERIQSTNQDPSANGRTTSTPTPCPPVDDFPRLIKDKCVTKFNGERIRLDYDTCVMHGDVPWAVDAAKITPLRSGGLLINLGDSLYRLDQSQHVIWRQPTPQTVFDYAYVESTNLIYGTAGDGIMFILNATTGKVELSDSRNGSAAYGFAQEYGDDMCLVTDNNVMYREKFRSYNVEPMKDAITCWRETKILWHLDFPPDAELVVNGKRILAVTKSKQAIYVKEITPPVAKSR